MEELSKRQIDQYSRTISLDEIKEEGQLKLLNSRVLVVGAGGLASSTILYLSSIGIGSINIIDFDKVSYDNLPRQILYSDEDVGKSKAEVIKDKYSKKNQDSKINVIKDKLTLKNAEEIIKGHDIVLDCVDNFETEFILNDICKKNNVPLVIAGVSGFKGQVMLVVKESKKDFKTLFSTTSFDVSKEDKEKDKPVFPLAVAIVSNIAASEAIKYLLNIGEHLIDEMLVIDVLAMRFIKYKL